LTKRLQSIFQKWAVKRYTCVQLHANPNLIAILENYVEGVEMGHLHGDSIADLKLPAKVSKKLVKDGYVFPHHVIPKSGWVSHEIRDNKDVEKIIELFRLQYDRFGKRR
jgi:Family of unknown function (DUF5519)